MKMQKILLIGAWLLVALNNASAEQAVANFENGNAAQWTWVGDVSNSAIKTTGGNPDGWFDSGSNYTSNQPGVGSFPPAGTELMTALASGSLRSVSFDFQRLDPGTCSPQSNDPGNFALTLFDVHTIGATSMPCTSVTNHPRMFPRGNRTVSQLTANRPRRLMAGRWKAQPMATRGAI
jgi:hypothetical protein